MTHIIKPVCMLLCLGMLYSCSSKKSDSKSASEIFYVYVTPSGKKYHRRDCRTIKGHEMKELTVEEAIKDGYGACKVCKPPTK